MASGKLKIWVLRDGEPLPTDPGPPRLLRDGMLCQTLAERGHEVTWITTTYDHYAHRQRAEGSQRHEVAPNYEIVLLKAPGYSSNISPARIWHNRVATRGLEKFAAEAGLHPDILVTDTPTTEWAEAVVRMAHAWGIPSVLSIRDLWPDFFVDFAPGPLRPLVPLVTRAFERQVRYACREATALLGVSQGYLDWGLRKGGRQRGRWDGVVPLGYAPPPPGTAAARQAILANLGVGSGETLVSFIGSWGRTYDLDLVVEAARLLRSEASLRFVIAGSGAGDEALRARMSALPNLVVPGWVDPAGIDAILSRSSVGLLPYRRNAPQGLPNKIYEYLSFGLVQVSNLAGEAEAFLAQTGAGLSVPHADPATLADAIKRAVTLHSPDFASQMQHLFRESYDLPVVYARYAELIEAMALERGAQP